MDDYVHRGSDLPTVQANNFPETAFHPIAFDRSAHDFSDRESEAGAVSFNPAKVKNCQV